MHTDSLLINALYYLLAAAIVVPLFKWVLVARVGHIDATVLMNPGIIGTIARCVEAGYAAGRRELMQTVIIYITEVEISNHIGD